MYMYATAGTAPQAAANPCLVCNAGLAAGGGTEGATGSGIADTCVDVDKWEGTTLADKLAAATATNQ